jgi:16S rRNA (adenine1518-N6/adenine1519-N6)-dimethyltransferase
MMALLEKTKLLLREHRIYPKKRLGQNFTVEASVFEQLINYASIQRSDVVLDIGAGFGFLTKLLSERSRKVLAVEFDSRLASLLRGEVEGLSNVEVIEGDVLKTPICLFDKVVSTPPYQISSQLVEWLLNRSFARAVLVFQREFADRLVAAVGSKDYGWLTVISYYYADVELLDIVPKWMFYPQPEVDSIIVRFKPRSQRPFAVKDEMLFKQVVQTLFTQRNRKLRNAITPFLKRMQPSVSKKKTAELADTIPFHDRRVRELAPEDFGAIADVFVL